MTNPRLRVREKEQAVNRKRGTVASFKTSISEGHLNAAIEPNEQPPFYSFTQNIQINYLCTRAGVVKLVDTHVSGTCALTSVGVRVPSSAQNTKGQFPEIALFLCAIFSFRFTFH